MKSLSRSALIFGFVLSPHLFASSAYLVDFDHAQGTTEFHAQGHPSALRINGKGHVPTGRLNFANGNFLGTLELDLSSLDTGIDLRTRHMKEKYLEVEKFPKAKLSLVQLPIPAEKQDQDFDIEKQPFSGVLSLHGIEHPIKGLITLKRTGQKALMKAEFTLKVSEYGITIPSFAGITVSDDVAVEVNADTPIVPNTSKISSKVSKDKN